MLAALLPFVTVLIEKRKSWPYCREYPFEPFELSKHHLRFLEKTHRQAQEYAFRYLERGYDNKGKTYRLVYDFLISQDGYTLALLGAGTLAAFAIKGVWLFSKTADGRVLVTITNQSADEYDMSGLNENNLILTDDFKKAFRCHVNKMNEHDWRFEPFAPGAELGDLQMLEMNRLQMLKDKNLIRFLDDEKDRWKYTVKGGAIFSVFGIARGIAKLPSSIWKGLANK